MKVIVSVPTINVNDEAVLIVRWHVADGVHVEAGARLVDVETTKAIATVQGEHSGWLKRRCKEGDEVAVGGDVAWLFGSEEEMAGACTQEGPAVLEKAPTGTKVSERLDDHIAPNITSTPVVHEREPTVLSPAAARLAASLNVNMTKLVEAKLGLLTIEGLRAFLEPAAEDLTRDDGLRRERVALAKRAEIDALRMGIGEHLRSSLSLHFDSASVRAYAKKAGYGLLPLILAELGPLLAEQPRFTAYFDHDDIIYYDSVNLGVAVDFGQGLKVVVVRDANRLDSMAISEQLAERALDYIENNLAIEHVTGGTFTVTDLSEFDILHFQPLINGRQSAILGIGADASREGHPMSLTIAFDHRVLTGREVGAFLKTLRDRLLRHSLFDASRLADQVCDMCLIDFASYYKEFGTNRYAVMTQYLRPDGKVGLICHRCLGGHI